MKCIGVSLQRPGRNIGRCLNTYWQNLTFDQSLSECSYVQLQTLAREQFPNVHYGIENVRISPSDSTILMVEYSVDSSD